MTKTFPPVQSQHTREGFYNDAEQASAFAAAAILTSGQPHVVTSEMGTLCPKCATAWIDSFEKLTLVVVAGQLSECYNCPPRG